MDWDHLRTFESVARLGSLTAAAKALGVSQSTVSRTLVQLEEHAGSPLLVRAVPVRLTARGEALLLALAPMIEGALAAHAALEETPELRGEVTLATVGEIVRFHLVEALPAFYARYPRLRLRILADNRIQSLAAGEADVALRLTRPVRGDLHARRVHRESYGYFAAADLALGPEVPWLGLTGSLSRIPEQRHAERAFARTPRLLVEDVEALGRAVEARLGVAILPEVLARRLRGVIAVPPGAVGALGAGDGPIPARDFWLVVHRAKQRLPEVRAVLDWLGRMPGFHVEGRASR